MAIYTIEDTQTGQLYKIEGPENASQRELQRFMAAQFQEEEEQPEPTNPYAGRPGLIGRTKDVGVGIVAGVPKAVGAVAGLGTYVRGLNKIADPVAEGLYSAGEFIDEKLLSNFQLSKKRELQTDIREAVKGMPPPPDDASVAEKTKYVADYIVSQGGAAGNFVVENPGQIFNLIGETLPYLFTGGAIAKGIDKSATVAKGISSPTSLIGKTADKVSKARGSTLAATGEGIVAAGDVGAGTAIQQRAEGNYDYSADRLYGLLAAPTTALIGAAGSRLGGVADADTLAAGIAGVSREGTDLLQRGLASRVSRGAGSEAAEEFFQSGTEQVFSNLSNNEPFYEGVGGSAVIGAYAGAGLGGAVNLRQQGNSETRINLDLDQVADEGQLKLDQLAQEKEVEQIGLAQTRQIKLDRMEAAKSFLPKSEFDKNRKAALEADVANPETTLGQQYIDYKLDNDIYPNTDKEEKAAQQKFIKDVTPADDKQTATAEYFAAMDAYAADLKAGRVTAVPNDQPKPAEDATAKPAKPAKPESVSRAAARKYAEEKLGPDWETIGGLSQEFANGTNFRRRKDGRSRWEDSVDAELAATQPVNTLAEEVADAAATLTAPEGLTEEQTRVFNVLSDHFLGDKKYDIDEVYAGGEWQAAKIAELANVKAGNTVSKAIKAFQTKVVENQGTINRSTKKSEKDAAVKALAETLSSRAKEQRAEQIQSSKPADVFDAAVNEDTSDSTGASLDNIKGTGAKVDAVIQSKLKSMPAVGAPIQGTETRSDADETLDSVEALDKAELGEGGGFSSRASAGQDNYSNTRAQDGGAAASKRAFKAANEALKKAGQEPVADITAKELEADTQKRGTTNTEVKEQAEARNAEVRQKDEALVTSSEPLLKGVWKGRTDSVPFDTLSMELKIDFMRSVFEFMETHRDDAILNEDINAIADQAQQEPVNETTENAQQERDAEVPEQVQDDSPTGVPKTESDGGNPDSAAGTDSSQSGSQEKVKPKPEEKPKGFKGKLNLIHGFKPPNYSIFKGQQGKVAPPTFVPAEEFSGTRYDGDGGQYGSVGVYLENPSSGEPLIFNDPKMDNQFFAPATAQVEAPFENAFILDPTTVSELEALTGLDMSQEASGPKAAVRLKNLGYDGLIVRGFSEAEAKINAIYEQEQREGRDYSVPLTAKAEARLEEAMKGFGGLSEDLAQNQIIHFNPEKLKTVKVFPKSFKEDPSQVNQIPSNPSIAKAAGTDSSQSGSQEKVKPKRLMPKSFKTGEAFVADVYHGTDTDIQEFDSSKLGQNTGAASASEAFFFAGKGETASTYAEIRSEKQNETEFKQTMTVAKKFLEKETLNAEDQQVLSNMMQRSNEMKGGKEFVESLIKAAEKAPGSVAVAARKMALQLRPVPRPNVQIQRIQMQNPLVKDFKGARFRDETYISLIKKAKEAGHDGVVLLNTYDVAGKRKEEITEADKDNIFAVFDAKDVTNTFKPRKDNTKFKKAAFDEEGLVTDEPSKDVANATSANEALDNIIQNGNRSERMLAKRIKDMAVFGDYKLVIVNDPETDLVEADFVNQEFLAESLNPTLALAAGKRDFEAAKDIWSRAEPPLGLYSEFGAASSDSPAGVIMLSGNPAMFGATNNTFLHEMMHALTANWLIRVREGDLVDGPAVKLSNKLQKLANKIDKFSRRNTAEDIADLMGVSTEVGDMVKNNVQNVINGSVDELIAYGFTEPTFQLFLDTLVIEQKKGVRNQSAWSSFVNYVRDFFDLSGTDAKTTTALNEVLRLTQTLFDQRVDAQAKESKLRRKMLAKHPIDRQAQLRANATGTWLAKSGMGGESAKNFLTDAMYVVRNPVKALKPLSKIIRENIDSLPSMGKAYRAMLEFEKTTNEFMLKLDPIARAAKELTQDRQNIVNDFLSKSTFYQKWGYDPQIKDKTVKVDPVLSTAFKKLTSQEQSIVKAVFMHGENTRKEMAQIAKDNNLPKEYLAVSKLDGPYAPFRRKGNFFTELKSAELVAAENDLKATTNKINRDKVEKLKTQEKHYVLKAFGSLSAAESYRRSNEGAYAKTSATEKEIGFDEDQRVDPQVLSKVMAAIGADKNSGLDTATRNAVQGIVEKIYASSLSENSARLSGLKRKNRAGYDENMLQSFFTHAHGQARLVAQMKHGKEINQQIANTREENKEGNRASQEAYNLFATHYQRYVNPASGLGVAIQDRIASINTVTTLTSSIGYHVTNALQPLINQQKMASDFNDYSGAMAAQIKAYKVAKDVIDGTVSNAVKSIGKQAFTTTTVGLIDFSNDVELDVSKAPKHMQEMLKNLQLEQLLDQGIEQDLNFESTMDTGYEAIDSTSAKFKEISDRLYQTARYVEAYNRVASAVAAFEMANKHRAKLAKMKMTAQEYAKAAVEDTQGNFSRLDSALVFKSLPKLMTQYRKYQVMMMWLWAGAFNKLFRGVDTADRLVGLRMLTYSAAHTALLSGVVGLPFLGQAATYFPALVGADDEEKDPKFDLERYIRTEVFPDDERMATLISRGVPSFFGVDMSQKLKQSDIFTPFPYSEFEASEDGAKNYVLEVLLGPTANQIGNVGRAARYLDGGDLSKATEAVMPKGIRTMLESIRLGREGFTMTNGDMILDPREFDLSSLMINALGIPATEVSKVKWTRGQQFEITQYFTKESGSIRNQYIEAGKNRDRAEQARLRKEFLELQKAKDRVRPFFNNAPGTLNRSSLMDLIRSPSEQVKRERKYRSQIVGN